MSFKIVTDSSADIKSIGFDIPFESVPLKIITDEREYVDDSSLDVVGMLADLKKYNGRSRSSCPNSQEYINAFGDAENVFCITITSGLSGSFNSATLAAKEYKNQHPERNIHVIDSLSTGAENALLIEKLGQLITEYNDFDKVKELITEYHNHTRLIFALESMHNLANNGRVSVISAKAAGLLGIRAVGKASDVGTLQPLSKCRGEEKALNYIVEYLKNEGCTSGKVYITHCFNESAALKLEEKLLKSMPRLTTKIYSCGGLCSFYAEKGGLLVGFEKN
jgi:DegV family protein with EDD domain